jgi:serine/threonine-protein kinase
VLIDAMMGLAAASGRLRMTRTDPDVDTVLAGRYRLRDRIGEGGMGEVWRATDEVLGRDVAVKMLVHGLLAKAEMRQRFRREAQALARLTHPRIARVQDFAENAESVFIVMELLVGQTLSRRLLRDDRIPSAEAAEIIAGAAEGLQAAHDAGIVHRDVKPANIMLTDSGPKVFDFGIAATAWDARLTTTGVLVGTLAYLSPERAAGRPGTPAGDVYALGVVLYEMLAGHPPYRASNPLALLHAYATEEPDPLPAEVPAGLAAACLHALAKNPELRPGSAAAFADEIRGAMADGRDGAVAGGRDTVRTVGRPVAPTRRQPVPSWIQPAKRRRPLGLEVAGVAGVVAAVAALALVLLTHLNRPTPAVAEPPPRTATSTEVPTSPLTTTAPQRRPVTTPTTEGTAMAALRQSLQQGAESGEIRADLSADLGRGLDDLQDDLDNGQRADAMNQINDLIRRIHTGLHEPDAITVSRATTLQSNLLVVASTLG